MICPEQNCGFTNLADSVYCEWCGKPLQAKPSLFSQFTSSFKKEEPFYFMYQQSGSRLSLTELLHLLGQHIETKKLSPGQHIQMTLCPQDKQVHLMDLGEVEGLRINGKLLPPYNPHLIANGNTIIDLGWIKSVSVNGGEVEAYDEAIIKNGELLTINNLRLVCCIK